MLRTTIIAAFCIWATASTPVRRDSPTVQLDDAIFTGATSNTISKFLGIPYVQPPVGDLRLRLPQPFSSYNASDGKTVTSYGPACYQQQSLLPNLPLVPQQVIDFITDSVNEVVTPDAEDCLTINVFGPANATSASKLPVLLWIYGGAFETGGTSKYDGTPIVQNSMKQGLPVIYVSMNYRLSAFGFMPGQEVKEAQIGNIGLQDQRAAMRWVQRYIGQFGGDPTKVTVWGESAGSISVGLHMVANNGDDEGLFRGAIMESGSPIPVGDIALGQKYFDAFVSQTGCSGASDKLECLRAVPYANYSAAVQASPSSYNYQGLMLAWVPRVDGVFLTNNPYSLIAAGNVSLVPMINGDVDDEGTLFALVTTNNITTTAKFQHYLQTLYFPLANSTAIEQILDLYPDDITQGSPFNTSVLNAYTPQYKRISAFLGDAVFQAPRRYFLNSRSGKQNIWSYVYKRFKVLPLLGSTHSSDSTGIYNLGDDFTNYIVRFAVNFDPNGGSDLTWPQYTTQSPTLMTFLDGVNVNLSILQLSQDTFRQAAISYLIELELEYPLFNPF